MARQRIVFSRIPAALFFTLLIGGAEAQEPATPPASTPPPAKVRRPNFPPGSPSPELENVRKALEALTPEQRQQFRENFTRWMALSPEEKKAVREVQELRHKKMAEEIEGALARSGLQLDPARHPAYVRRYTEERRKIEEQLRAETDAKRAPMVEALIERLKKEFTSALDAPK